VLWGWCAYFYSAADGCGNKGSDYTGHGNLFFLDWYLQQMKAYEQQHGVRILDYLDLHIYPQGDGVYSTDAGNAATQALRLRSTRALWDPTYQDESWIPDKVMLIPRMKAWVNNNYPGTKLAISEYNWGAFTSINGALAEADVLGIFGREGLDMAALWVAPNPTDPVAYVFRLYRNYDSQGSAFGDTSLQAASADQDKLAIYAAQRSNDMALTLIVINKTDTNLTSGVSLANFKPADSASVYLYNAANLNAIVKQADQAISGNDFEATFPASSITLFVIPAAR